MILATFHQCSQSISGSSMETALQSLSRKSITSTMFSQITLCLLKAGRQRVRKLELAGILLEDVRYDGMDHTLGSTSQKRCKVCSKNTKNMCKKGNVRLHTERGNYVSKNIIAIKKMIT